MAHVATFNASSEYAGQQVMYYRGMSHRMGTPFEIAGSGDVDVTFIIGRDHAGELDWVGEDERTWVYSYALQSPAGIPARYIDDSTPLPPDGALPAHGVPVPGTVEAERVYGDGGLPTLPMHKRPWFIVLVVVGIFLLCSCCFSSSAFILPFLT